MRDRRRDCFDMDAAPELVQLGGIGGAVRVQGQNRLEVVDRLGVIILLLVQRPEQGVCRSGVGVDRQRGLTRCDSCGDVARLIVPESHVEQAGQAVYGLLILARGKVLDRQHHRPVTVIDLRAAFFTILTIHGVARVAVVAVHLPLLQIYPTQAHLISSPPQRWSCENLSNFVP